MQNGSGQTTSYMAAMQQHGIRPEDMARRLSSMGFGSEQAFMHLFRTGDKSGFTQEHRDRAEAYFRNNPNVLPGLEQMMFGRQ